MKKVQKIFACDFETTVFEGQQFTEVWSSAFVELFDPTETVTIHGCIEDTIQYFAKAKFNSLLYYHNLKFDGSFIIDYLLRNGYTQAFDIDGTECHAIENKYMDNKTFKYTITEMGQWFTITIKVNNHFIEIRDSLKLLPFSLRQISDAFKTKHKKLEMEYEGRRYKNCPISDKEKEYIKNDVLVLKEALEFMFEQGHKELTIGSCCLKEFKEIFNKKYCLSKEDYEGFFPDLENVTLDKNLYGAENADAYIRKSYKGGWCYVVPSRANKVIDKGLTGDVNSLYPYSMHSSSGNRFPVGLPTFWKASEIPSECYEKDRYFFVRFRCRFKIKDKHLPFLQIKNSYLYKGNEMLTTSDYYDKVTKKYYRYYNDHNGVMHDTSCLLTMTMTDWVLFNEHYDLLDLEILDGCYFSTMIGIFDDYINKYMEIKMNSKGAMRSMAKLFLNNLYGKFATSKKAPFKVAYLDDKNMVHFMPFDTNEKKIGYIPIGTAITSYARNYTIRSAQANFDTFCYSDTDSIHLACSIDKVVGIKIDSKKLGYWKIETYWDEAIFVRQKTYIEHVTHEDMEEVEKPYYNIKCASMPEGCKKLLQHSMEQDLTHEEIMKYKYEDERVFLNERRRITDFKVGLKVPSALKQRRIYGGVVLYRQTFEMKE